MRAALPVLSRSVLPVLSRSSARAPSRLVSTEAAAEGSTASKPGRVATSRGDRLVKEMTPVATFLGIVVTIGAIGAYYSSRLAALEERMMGSVSTLKSDMAGTAGRLEERVAGAEKSLQERVTGILKEVDAKNTGSEKAVDAKIAGSEKTLQERVAGIEKAADLVRFLLRTRLRALPTHSLTCLPSPSCSPRPSDALVAVSVTHIVAAAHAVFFVVGRCISGIGRCAER